MLRGSEVKSLREAQCQIAEAFGRVARGEVWLHNLHIGAYSHSGGLAMGHDPERVRKLLLNRSEITRLSSKLAQERLLTLVPLSIYFKDGRAKVELAVARGRKKGDRRQDIAKKDADRERRDAMRRRR